MKAGKAEGEGPEEKPFLEHLDELRGTLILCLASLGIATVLSFFLVVRGDVLSLLKRPLLQGLRSIADPEQVARQLVVFKPAGGFVVAAKLSLAAGFFLSLPLNLYFIGRFILPALTRRERGLLFPAFSAGAVLFAVGILFGYLLMLPLALRVFWLFNRGMGLTNFWTLEEYISFAAPFLIAFGVVFEMPVVLVILVRLGVLSVATLRAKRKYVIVIIFVLAAVLTPSDPITQVGMALPMLVLYELCILIGGRLPKGEQGGEGKKEL